MIKLRTFFISAISIAVTFFTLGISHQYTFAEDAKPAKVLANKGEACEGAPPVPLGFSEVPPEADDQQIAEKAIKECFHTFSEKEKEYQNALTLLQVERELQIPYVVRGLSLASACVESGFNASALGDHSFSKDGKTPMAVGILQMWPWYVTHYKADRKNVRSAATAWLDHIKKQRSYVERVCKPKSEEETWRLALVHGIRSGKKGGRCKENTTHWVKFKKMNLVQAL